MPWSQQRASTLPDLRSCVRALESHWKEPKIEPPVEWWICPAETCAWDTSWHIMTHWQEKRRVVDFWCLTEIVQLGPRLKKCLECGSIGSASLTFICFISFCSASCKSQIEGSRQELQTKKWQDVRTCSSWVMFSSKGITAALWHVWIGMDHSLCMFVPHNSMRFVEILHSRQLRQLLENHQISSLGPVDRIANTVAVVTQAL